MKRTAFVVFLSLLALFAAAEQVAEAEVYEEGPQATQPEALEAAEASLETTEDVEYGPMKGEMDEEEVVRPKLEDVATPVTQEQEQTMEVVEDSQDDVLNVLDLEEDQEEGHVGKTGTVDYLQKKIEEGLEAHEKARRELAKARQAVNDARGVDDKAKAKLVAAQLAFEKASATLDNSVKNCKAMMELNAREAAVVRSMIKMLNHLEKQKKKPSQRDLEELQIAAQQVAAIQNTHDAETQAAINDLAQGRRSDDTKQIRKLMDDLLKKLTSHDCVAENAKLTKAFAAATKQKESTTRVQKATGTELAKKTVAKDKLSAEESQTRKNVEELKETLSLVKGDGEACKKSTLEKSRNYWMAKAKELANTEAGKKAASQHCDEDDAEDIGDWKDKNAGRYQKVREANSDKFVATYENFDFYKIKLPAGKIMTGKHLVDACNAVKMFTPCDHVAYNDGHCMPVFYQGHMSYNNHHRFPRKPIAHTYWYARQGRTLENTGSSHRWSNNNDKGGHTFCVLPTEFKRLTLVWNHWRFYKVRVAGNVDSAGIYATCKQHGLYTPCCHASWADGKCVTVNHHGYMSYNNHHNFPRKAIDWTYWYSAKAHRGFSLQNWHNTHRWSIKHEKEGQTFCVGPAKKPDPSKVVATWNGFKFHKVAINGRPHITDNHIREACKNAGYLTVCDHRAYADGHCIVVNPHGHMSYNGHHNFNRDVIDHVYFYAGNRNRGWALQNWRNTHRWSNKGDIFGNTFCVEQPRINKEWANEPQFTLNGFEFFKTRVNGQVNSAAIRAACKAMGLAVPCDHPAYADGHCVAVMKHARHLSYNPHHSLPRNKMDGTFFYCGGAHKQRSLENYKNTHRWSTKGDMYVPTMCVKAPPAPDPKEVQATWRGYKWYKVRIEGVATQHNLLKACAKYGYQTPCDHKAYQDGRCKWVGNNGHMSYSRHHSFDRNIIDETYWYARNANRGWTLENWSNTHRWSAKGDLYGNTMCIKKATGEEEEQEDAQEDDSQDDNQEAPQEPETEDVEEADPETEDVEEADLETSMDDLE